MTKVSNGTAHEGLDRLRAEALDYELMGEELRAEIADMRRERDGK